MVKGMSTHLVQSFSNCCYFARSSSSTNSAMPATVPSSNCNRSNPLRSSCDLCAAAKIRCSKEKPECLRCVRRSLSCSYSIPKRPGRPAHNRQNQQHSSSVRCYPQAIDATIDASPVSARRPRLSSSSISIPATPSDSILGDHSRQYDDGPDSLSTISAPEMSQGLTPLHLPWESGSVNSPITSPEVDGIFGFAFPATHSSSISKLPDWLTEPMVIDQMQSGAGLTPAHQCDQPFSSLFDQPQLQPFSPVMYNADLGNLTSEKDPVAPPAADIAAVFGSRSVDTSTASLGQTLPTACSCQSLALQMIMQARPSQKQIACLLGEQPHSFEAVLDMSFNTIRAMDGIFSCTCAKDLYLLVILTLVACKTLEWFEAAALVGTPHASGLISQPTVDIGGKPCTGESSGRIAAQLVLSRLPGMQKLVNTLLAQTFPLPGSTPENNSDDVHPNALGGALINCLSSNLAQSLAADLRKQTINLARKVSAQLR